MRAAGSDSTAGSRLRRLTASRRPHHSVSGSSWSKASDSSAASTSSHRRVFRAGGDLAITPPPAPARAPPRPPGPPWAKGEPPPGGAAPHPRAFLAAGGDLADPRAPPRAVVRLELHPRRVLGADRTGPPVAAARRERLAVRSAHA